MIFFLLVLIRFFSNIFKLFYRITRAYQTCYIELDNFYRRTVCDTLIQLKIVENLDRLNICGCKSYITRAAETLCII